MANVHVIEANLVEAKSARFNPRRMLAKPTAQVLLISAAIFVGATAWVGLDFALLVTVVPGCAAFVGLRLRYWRDRARARAQQPKPMPGVRMTEAEHDELDSREQRMRDFPADVITTLMVLAVYFGLIVALGGVELAFRVMGPTCLGMPFVFLLWHYRSRA